MYRTVMMFPWASLSVHVNYSFLFFLVLISLSFQLLDHTDEIRISKT